MALGVVLIVVAVTKLSPGRITNASSSPSASLSPSTPSSTPSAGGPSPSTSPSASFSPTQVAHETSGTKIVTTGSRSSQSDGLTLTVDRIEQQDGSLNVLLRAVNNGSDSLALPIFGYFFLIDNTGKTYAVNPNAGDWLINVPPGATVTGTIVVTQPLATGVQTVRVGFSHVFGSFKISSITVVGIPIASG